jgi:hypothetical protein
MWREYEILTDQLKITIHQGRANPEQLREEWNNMQRSFQRSIS